MSMSSAGRAVSLSDCAARPKGRETGLHGFAVQIQLCSLTGSYVMATAEQREPDDARVSSPDVCPVKASVFSRRQTCRGKSQAPRSSDGRVAGNQDSEAYRRGLSSGRLQVTGP